MMGLHTKLATRRTRRWFEVQALEDRLAPAVAYALSNNTLLPFDTTNPGAALAPIAVTGLTAGENLVDIDFRPQNGLLYGLGYEGTAGTATLYAVSTRTGIATALSKTPGQFMDAGGAPVRIGVDANTQFGIDFNPTVDRLRIVNNAGQNFRMNPNTGTFIDGDLGGAPGSVPMLNMDGGINGLTTVVDGTAYTNNAPNVTVTTQYTLDTTTNSLYIQNAPNAGEQKNAVAVTPTFTGVSGFDIPAGVDTTTSNTPVAAGSGFAVLTVGGTDGLYELDLVAGSTKFLGAFTGNPTIQGLAVQSEAIPGGIPVTALNIDGTQLLRFNSLTPGTLTTVAITGVVAGEQLVAIDYRPTTGQLFGIGFDTIANQTATLYLIDPQGKAGTTTATVVGTAGSIQFQDGAGTPVTFPVPNLTDFGFDFNPTVDRIRIVTSTGLNFRVDPNTGLPVDGDLGGPAGSVANVNTDGDINGPTTTVDGTAYTNSFPQFAASKVTTQYTIDIITDKLYIQNPPNSGTQTLGIPITDLNGVPLDLDVVAEFDIPANVLAPAPNAPVDTLLGGFGYANMVVSGVEGFYRINLTNGKSELLGTTFDLAGTALADSPIGAAQFSVASVDVAEDAGAAVLTLTRTGGSIGAATVTLTVTGGTAVEGTNFPAQTVVATFADGQTTTTVNFSVISDGVVSGPLTVELALGTSSNGLVAAAQNKITVNILNTDAAPAITSADNATFVVGTAGTFTVTSTGVPVSALTITGALPTGVTFVDNGDGTATLAGTPDAGQGGAYPVTITAANGVGMDATQSFTLTVNDAPAITSANTTTFTEGTAGTFTVTATGFPTTFTYTLTGALPTGVTFDNTTGVLSGTPAVGTTGNFPVTITASNGVGTDATQAFTLVVSNTNTTPAFTSANATTFVVGTAGTFTVTATGAPTPILSFTGTLPTGVTFTPATGILSGTPTQAGSFPLTFTATNAAGTVDQTFTLTVNATPTITSANATTFTLNAASTFTFTATGTPAPTLTVAGTLPTGVTFNAATASLTGTPTQSGTFPLTVTATNATGSVNQSFTLTVAASGTAPLITSTAPTTGRVGTAFSLTVTATGSTPLTFAATNLPAGLSINSTTGLLSGTPTTAGTFTGTITATNSLGTNTQAFTIRVQQRFAAGAELVSVSGSPSGTASTFSFNASKQLTAVTGASNFAPFSGLGTGDVRSTTGDVNGDGVADRIYASGPNVGAGDLVRIIDGVTGKDLLSGTNFSTYAGENFSTIGIFVAAADIDGDGKAEVVVSPDQGGGARVQVFRFQGGSLVQVANFFGIEDPAFRGGGRLALGDINADGFADVIVAAGFGGGPRIAVFSGKNLTSFGSAGSPPKLFGDFVVFEPGLRNGTWVTAGDTNGDGFADLVFGGGPGGGPRVFAIDGKTAFTSSPTAANNSPLLNFFAFNADQRGGVRVALKDIDNDARLDLTVGSGEGNASSVRTYLAANFPANGQGEPTLTQAFDPFSATLTNGVFVG
jgi:hypothetical protein